MKINKQPQNQNIQYSQLVRQGSKNDVTLKQNFKGYDARKIEGFIMSSNYADISEEMRNIGKTENFKVFSPQLTENGRIMTTNAVPKNKTFQGAWAQDLWGIVKGSLLQFEESDKADAIKKLFNLKENSTQSMSRKKEPIADFVKIVDMLLNMPLGISNGIPCRVFIHPETKVANPLTLDFVDKELEVKKKTLKELLDKTHVPGGNYFIVKGNKNDNGADELLIGADELKKFDTNQIKKMFSVQKIHVLPQMDYHLDLFIRPLDNKRVLIADDDLMLKVLKEGLQKIVSVVSSHELPIDKKELLRQPYVSLATYLENFKMISETNPMPSLNETEKVLKEGGFEVIKVPGRIYNLSKSNEKNLDSKEYILKQLHNYLNANALINDKNELVYITNKSNLDEEFGITKEVQELLGFSLQQKFIESLEPYVKKEKIYFVSGENDAISKEVLSEFQGGIHCMSAEIPRIN